MGCWRVLRRKSDPQTPVGIKKGRREAVIQQFSVLTHMIQVWPSITRNIKPGWCFRVRRGGKGGIVVVTQRCKDPIPARIDPWGRSFCWLTATRRPIEDATAKWQNRRDLRTREGGFTDEDHLVHDRNSESDFRKKMTYQKCWDWTPWGQRETRCSPTSASSWMRRWTPKTGKRTARSKLAKIRFWPNLSLKNGFQRTCKLWSRMKSTHCVVTTCMS